MQHNGVTYLPTWQIWEMIRPQPRGDAASMDGDETLVNNDSRRAVRERVQIARIEQRMTVNELANRVKCDTDTIVAFECGDEILSEELQRRIRMELRIE